MLERTNTPDLSTPISPNDITRSPAEPTPASDVTPTELSSASDESTTQPGPARPKTTPASATTPTQTGPSHPKTAPSSAATPTARPAEGRKTPRPASARKYERLSVLLRNIPPDELTGLLANYRAAVLNGPVEALVVNDRPPFKALILDEHLHETPLPATEELVRVTPEWNCWLTSERRASRLAVRAKRGEASVKADAFKDNDEDFEALLEIRRATLRAEAER